MAFISEIWPHTTLEMSLFQRDTTKLCIVKIGYDDTDGFNYSLMADIGQSECGNEFSFFLVEHNAESEEDREIFDGLEVAKIIPKYAKAAILETLAKMSQTLVVSTNFDSFYMTTFSNRLPDKALKKYRRLCHVFENAGYEVSELEPEEEDERYIWFMSKSEC